MVGLGRIELQTSRLSCVRSNHRSYRPSRLSNRHGPATRSSASGANRTSRCASWGSNFTSSDSVGALKRRPSVLIF